jgi:serine/threonine-protein kinase
MGRMSASVPADAFAIFDEQDSGCVSYGAVRAGRKLFVKSAQTPGGRESLRRAIAFHASVEHPAIVRPLDVVEAPDQMTLVYPWCEGEVLNHATTRGSDRQALERFRGLGIEDALVAIDTILDAHESVAAAGFVSVDLYDGCFLYDFDGHDMRLVDLDEYRPGPFALAADRLPGSRRYMAPEEFRRGAIIDERTMVFHLGRTIAELLEGEHGSKCSDERRRVVEEATREESGARFSTVAALLRAWRGA